MHKYPLYRFSIVDSSQLEAHRYFYYYKKPHFAILADTQANGFGRKGKIWHSYVGNLSLSLVIDRSNCIFLPLVMAVIVIRALIHLCPGLSSFLSLKWPNDILLDRAKLGGIIIQTYYVPLQHIIIGIGINVLCAPKLEQYPTTCLSDYNYSPSTEDLAQSIIKQWNIFEISANEELNLLREWEYYAHSQGTKLCVRTQNQLFHGTYAGLDNNGNLLLRTKKGFEIIRVGECSFN